MEISTDNEAEERIAILEKRVRDMDALLKGLTAEILDLKAASMAFSRQDAERSRRQLKQAVIQGTMSSAPADSSSAPSAAIPTDDSTAVPAARVSAEDAPVAPPEPAMVRIMQQDGTMKLEPRYGKKKMI
jgi:hypothetical protein